MVENPVDVLGAFDDAGPKVFVGGEDLKIVRFDKLGEEIGLKVCQVFGNLTAPVVDGEALQEVRDTGSELDRHGVWTGLDRAALDCNPRSDERRPFLCTSRAKIGLRRAQNLSDT